MVRVKVRNLIMWYVCERKTKIEVISYHLFVFPPSIFAPTLFQPSPRTGYRLINPNSISDASYRNFLIIITE